MGYYQKKQANNSFSNFGETQPEMELSEAIEEFTMMAKVDGRAEDTLDLYDYVFGRFTDFTVKEEIGNFRPKDIRKYLSSLMDEGLANTTVAVHYRVIKALFNWLQKEHYLEKNPVDPIDEPRTPDEFPTVLDEEQVEALLEAEKSRDVWAGFRNYVILLTFIDTGMRLNEFRNAKIEDLDLENYSIKVHGKGAKDRKVFFGKKTAKALHRWLRVRDDMGQVWDDTIFIDQKGNNIKERNVQRIISKAQERAGLEDTKVSAHVLRHTAATFAVKNGLKAFPLKQQFGWERIKTALRYVHMAGDEVGKAYRESSPLSEIRE